MNRRVLLFGVVGAVLVGLFYVAQMMYREEQKKRLDFLASENAELFVRDHSPRFGDKDAKVIVTEFLDPECESCRMFYPIVKNLMEEFKGKVQLVVRYAPFHRNSIVAVKALEAARMQGKYWESLEILFFHQPRWGDHHNPQPGLIFEILPSVGLDMEQLRKDMEDPSIMGIVEQDGEDLRALNVRVTPTFFVNGRKLEDFGYDGLKKLIEEEIAKVY